MFDVDELAVYQFALTKHGDELAGLLKGFHGVVMCDAESRLNEIFRTEGVRLANDNTHPRRAFRDAEAVQLSAAKEAGRFIANMYEIERRALREGLIWRSAGPSRPDRAPHGQRVSENTFSALLENAMSCGIRQVAMFWQGAVAASTTAVLFQADSG